MGDRALIQFTDGDDYSPITYLHWSGYKVREYLEALKERMKGREGDLAYTAARFVGICHDDIEGNLSLGLWNQDKPLTEDDSHGDAGCFVVNVETWDVQQLGGYGLQS